MECETGKITIGEMKLLFGSLSFQEKTLLLMNFLLHLCIKFCETVYNNTQLELCSYIKQSGYAKNRNVSFKVPQDKVDEIKLVEK